MNKERFTKHKGTELLFKEKIRAQALICMCLQGTRATFCLFPKVVSECISINPHSKGNKTLLGILYKSVFIIPLYSDLNSFATD